MQYEVAAYMVESGRVSPVLALERVMGLCRLAGDRARHGIVGMDDEGYLLRLNLLTGMALFGTALWRTQDADQARLLFTWLLRGWAYPDAAVRVPNEAAQRLVQRTDPQVATDRHPGRCTGDSRTKS